MITAGIELWFNLENSPFKNGWFKAHSEND